MHILISSVPQDVDAAVVTLALRDKGHEVTLVYGEDFPVQRSMSLELGNGHPSDLCILEGEHELAVDNVDSVWARRPRFHGPLSSLHPDDLEFGNQEAEYFSRSVWQLTAPEGFWVNPWGSDLRAKKPTQLIVAEKLGLHIPKTLMSNDPDRIKAFVRDSRHGTIYKSFRPFAWTEPNGDQHLLYTSEVDIEQLGNNHTLRLVPGIYQEKLAKAYEIRATFMGATCMAVALDTQATSTFRIDSRGNRLEQPPFSPTELPENIQAACHRLMQHFGIVFGCFDFVVTPQGQYVFLEVNTAGQFLYVEEKVSELTLLDAFCEFLVSRTADFKYDRSYEPVALQTYLQDPRLNDLVQKSTPSMGSGTAP